jgi:hypothetical protein
MNTAMRYVSFILLLVSCVEPVRLPELSSQPVLVVDGMITDEPATHSVVLSFSGTVDHDVDNPNRVTGALVTIVNDLQEEHELSESGPGVYLTGPEFKGIVGRTYKLKIRTADGTEYESVPSLLKQGGLIDSVYREIRTNVINKDDPTKAQHALYLYLKGTVSPEASLVRWRWRATYHALTQPQLVTDFIEGEAVTAPLPCSGYVGGGKTN